MERVAVAWVVDHIVCRLSRIDSDHVYVVADKLNMEGISQSLVANGIIACVLFIQ